MARFYAEIQGNRGSASRMGTPNSGIEGHIRGWDVGVKVYGSVIGYVDSGKLQTDDEFQVVVTSGSNGRLSSYSIGTVKLIDGKPTFVQTEDEANRTVLEV